VQNPLIYLMVVAGLPHRWLAGLPVRFQKWVAETSFAEAGGRRAHFQGSPPAGSV
jgi:hypothetical protein